MCASDGPNFPRGGLTQAVRLSEAQLKRTADHEKEAGNYLTTERLLQASSDTFVGGTSLGLHAIVSGGNPHFQFPSVNMGRRTNGCSVRAPGIEPGIFCV